MKPSQSRLPNWKYCTWNSAFGKGTPRAALRLETRALARRYASATPDLIADLQAALDLVPAGRADGARARVLTTMARYAHPDYAPETAAALEEALRLAQRAGEPDTEAKALADLAMLKSADGDDPAALEMLGRARAIAGGASAYGSLLAAAINESHVLEGMGQHERAADVARAGIASADDYGLARSSGTFLAINVAEPLAALGQWDEAAEVLEHALALSPTQYTNRVALRQLAATGWRQRGALPLEHLGAAMLVKHNRIGELGPHAATLLSGAIRCGLAAAAGLPLPPMPAGGRVDILARHDY